MKNSNIYLFTNNFMSPPNIFRPDLEEYYEYLPFVLGEDSEYILQAQPLLLTKQIFYTTIERMEYRDKVKLITAVEKIHPDNILYINCSYNSEKEISSLLATHNIHHVTQNMNYADIDMFEEYCYMLGLTEFKTIEELHKRLRGKLSSSLTYIQELQIGTSLNRLIAYEGRANFSKFIGVFLGMNKSKRDLQYFFRVLRREHPNYMKAILKSQLKMLIKMKENQLLLTRSNMSFDDLKIDRKFGKVYINKLQVISLPTLYHIKRDLQDLRATETSILLLMLKYDNGGYVPPNKEVI